MVRPASANHNVKVSRKSWTFRPARSLRYTCITLGTFLSLSFAQGENVNDVDQLSLGDLLNMKLTTGSLLDLNLSKSPMSITVIDEKQIKTSSARNLSELLEIFVPGFVYGYNKWNGTVWGMRGVFNDRNTKVLCLVNGHKMNPQSRDGYQSETVLGAIGDYKRVEVLRGPAALVYGSGAIAGIVNIITKSAKEETSSDISVRYDDRKTIEPQVNIYMKPDENNCITFTTGFRRSEGIPQAQTNIYGKDLWPFPGTDKSVTPHNGIPSDGSYDNPDGNWRVSAEWAFKDLLKLYIRGTHQEENAGGWFPYDPWPEYFGSPDSTAPNRNLGPGADGPSVKWNDPFWANTESWGCNQRQYVIDNMMSDLEFKIPLSGNELKVSAGFDGYANKLMTERRYAYTLGNERNDRGAKRLENEFGELRYSASAMYHIKTVNKLQAAGGIEYRLDQIGNGLFCGNSQAGQTGKKVVDDINYQTFTGVGEALYDFTEQFALEGGVRADFHTRATLVNGKIAAIYSPAENHTIKLIGQTSSNNGSADEYEYNRNHFLDNNVVRAGGVLFDDVTKAPSAGTNILTVPSPDEMHNLKPERAFSAEVDYVGELFDMLTIIPSVSVTKIKDLFTWDQPSFRAINCNGYSFMNGDLEAKFHLGPIEIGASHSYTQLVNTDVNKGTKSTYWVKDTSKIKPGVVWYDSTVTSSGKLEYSPKKEYLIQQENTTYLVKTTVSADNKTFKNIPTQMSKIYLTYTPANWVTFSTNARIWWGLDGRSGSATATDPNKQMLAYQQSTQDMNVFNVDTKPVVKLNACLYLQLPKDFSVTLNANDLLGIDKGPYSYDDQDSKFRRNTLRYEQAEMYGMASVDRQSFGITVAKAF